MTIVLLILGNLTLVALLLIWWVIRGKDAWVGADILAGCIVYFFITFILQ